MADKGKTLTTLKEKEDQAIAKLSPVMTREKGTDPVEPVIDGSESKDASSPSQGSQPQKLDAIEDGDPKDETGLVSFPAPRAWLRQRAKA